MHVSLCFFYKSENRCCGGRGILFHDGGSKNNTFIKFYTVFQNIVYKKQVISEGEGQLTKTLLDVASLSIKTSKLRYRLIMRSQYQYMNTCFFMFFICKLMFVTSVVCLDCCKLVANFTQLIRLAMFASFVGQLNHVYKIGYPCGKKFILVLGNTEI